MNTIKVDLWQGDCRIRLRELPDDSVDLFLTDPPYELAFMSAKWDATGVAFDPNVYRQMLRALKSEGKAKIFSHSRTYHRVCKAMETAGFLGVKDNLEAWVYASGFPKAHDISKSIDKRLGATRKVVGHKKGVGGENLNDIVRGVEVRQTTDEGGKGVGAYGVGAKQVSIDIPITEPETEEAKLWKGYKTAIKPAWEPIIVGSKPK